MIETVVSFILGVVVTWVVSHVYYKRAGDELRKEAAKLRRLMTMMLTSMERQGWAKLTRDSKGDITGYELEQEMSAAVGFKGELGVKFIPAKKPESSANG